MYLVELRPGKEELYRSSDELALAIRNGDVDARSRVYHRATAKWISITLHPQYKAIVASAKEEETPRPARRGWNLLGGSSDQIKQVPEANSSNNGHQVLYRWRRPLALGIAVLLLFSGMQIAFSGPRPPWSGKSQRVTSNRALERRSAAANFPGGRKLSRPAPTQGSKVGGLPTLVSLASSRKTWDAADPQTNTKLSRVLPRAPRLRSTFIGEALAPEGVKPVKANPLEALIMRYEAARDSARTRLEGGMRVARLNRLFAPSRLTPNGGVTDTRMSLAGVANVVRVYRQHQAIIDRAYQDTVVALAREQGWSPKKVRAWYSRTEKKEAPGLELLSGALLASIDSVFGVLTQQAGAYKLRGTAIAFEDPTAGQAYGALRRRIEEQIAAAVTAGAATSPGPTGLLLQAIGTTSLPRET
jgi:hypothetical protein